jgi:uncharacterized membrane protein
METNMELPEWVPSTGQIVEFFIISAIAGSFVYSLITKDSVLEKKSAVVSIFCTFVIGYFTIQLMTVSAEMQGTSMNMQSTNVKMALLDTERETLRFQFFENNRTKNNAAITILALNDLINAINTALENDVVIDLSVERAKIEDIFYNVDLTGEYSIYLLSIALNIQRIEVIAVQREIDRAEYASILKELTGDIRDVVCVAWADLRKELEPDQEAARPVRDEAGSVDQSPMVEEAIVESCKN